MLLLIDNNDSFTHNLWQWLQADSDAEVVVKRHDELTSAQLEYESLKGIILSPGPGTATNPADLGICQTVLVTCPPGLPLLGVCLGMQAMLVNHSNAQLVQCPTVVHGKTHLIDRAMTGSWLLDNVPNNFQVMRYHSWAVAYDADISPYHLTASGDGWVMAIEHQANPWAGVQFHPESIGTPEGRRILQNFLAKAGCLKNMVESVV